MIDRDSSPADNLPQLDYSNEFTRVAAGNIRAANCNILARDVDFVRHSDLLKKLQAQAADNFTLVHVTSAEAAQRIAQDGYKLDRSHPSSPFAYSFVPVVPEAYPNAAEINTAALSYRYRGFGTKLVFQFPFPFPAKSLESTSRMIWGNTPLNNIPGALESGVFIKEPNGSYHLPAEFLAGVIDLDTQEYTSLRPEPTAESTQEQKHPSGIRKRLQNLGEWALSRSKIR